MANVEHNTLTGSALHENKGVAAATDNTVATAVSGATVWAKLTASNLQTTGNPFGGQLLHVWDQKTANTDGGSFTSGSYVTRTLNTSVTNEISGASLASNQITLPSGTYFIVAFAPAHYMTDAHKARFRNVTDNTTLVVGTSESSNVNDTGQHHSWVIGRFTLSGTKVCELQHRASTTKNTDGLGVAVNLGEVEIYSQVLIWKVA